jgi:molecular chaperone GrpE
MTTSNKAATMQNQQEHAGSATTPDSGVVADLELHMHDDAGQEALEATPCDMNDAALAGQEPEALDELSVARAEADDLRDKYVRLQAEWDNYRKRTSAERDAERQRAASKLVEKLLPIVDDLERAITHSDTASEASLKEGIQAVYTKLEDVLEKEGVVAVDPTGQPFDANMHSAVGTVEDASLEADTITQVYQKGYEIKGQLLRPAMVVVSTQA